MYKLTLNNEALTVRSLDCLNDSQKQDLATKYIDSQTVYMMNEQVEYILRASYEDENVPFCYDDITNNTPTGQIEINGQWWTLDSDDRDEKLEFYNYLEGKAWHHYQNVIGLSENYKKSEENHTRIGDIRDELQTMEFEDFPEVLQWFLVSDNLAYHLEEHNECMIDNMYWGRTCFGQSIILDRVIQKIAFTVLSEEIPD